MKYVNSLIALILLLNTISAQGIHFEDNLSWKDVLATAKRENKYIFIDAYATWCGPCKMMDEQTYPDPNLGAFMNGNFISVKVQTDETPKDNDYVISWRRDAKELVSKYAIRGVPTFLFFNPHGEMVHRSGAFQNSGRFTITAKFALAPERGHYYSALEKYRKGERDYDRMLDLILTTKDMVGDKELAFQMAKDYKKYLESNFKAKGLKKENLDFIAQYSGLITSKDKFFRAFYKNPEKINTIVKTPEWAEYYVKQTLTREELERKLTKDGKGTIKFPDFKAYEMQIAKKYRKIDAYQLVTNFKVNYYRVYHPDWKLWSDAKEDQLRYSIPHLDDEMGTIYMPYNVYGAWDVFLHCNDIHVLNKSLSWINKAIDFVPNDRKAPYVDTKASVLYKLGKVDEAIEMERWAIELAKKKSKANEAEVNGFEKILMKMQSREPIYEEGGAEWDKTTLANIRK